MLKVAVVWGSQMFTSEQEYTSAMRSVASSSILGTNTPDVWLVTKRTSSDAVRKIIALVAEVKSFLDSDTTTVKTDKVKEGWLQGMMYLVTGWELCGTWIGMVLVNERFSRIVALSPGTRVYAGGGVQVGTGIGDRVAVGGEGEDEGDERGDGDKMPILCVEVSDEFKSVHANFTLASSTVDAFLDLVDIPTSIAHSLSNRGPDRGSPQSRAGIFTISDDALRVLRHTIITALNLLAGVPLEPRDGPWNALPTPGADLLERIKETGSDEDVGSWWEKKMDSSDFAALAQRKRQVREMQREEKKRKLEMEIVDWCI